MHTFATDIPHTILIYSQFLTHSKIGIHHLNVNFTKSGLTETGNRLQGHYYGYVGARKKPAKKKCQEIWMGTMAQTKSS